MAQMAQEPYTAPEIDLGRYIDILGRRWLIILLTCVLCLAVAAVYLFLVARPQYRATAGVLIQPTRADLSFDPKFRTEQQPYTDPAARRTAFTSLGQSSAIAAQVIQKIGPSLTSAERQLGVLIGSVTVSNRGDLIEITASSSAPDTAAAIANAWAEAFVAEVNQAYQGATQSPAEIQAQVQAARANYLQAQQAFEQVIGDNKLASLDEQAKARRAEIAGINLTLTRLNRIIGDVQALRDRLRQSTAPASSNTLPMALLRMNAFGVSSDLPIEARQAITGAAQAQTQVQLNLENTPSTTTVADQLREVEETLAILEARRRDLQTQAVAPRLQQELATLEQAYEAQAAAQRAAIQQRDLAWDTYNTLSRKQAEVEVASSLSGNQVRQAVRAEAPDEPMSMRRLQILGVAGLVGLTLGVLLAFFAEYRQTRRPTSQAA